MNPSQHDPSRLQRVPALVTQRHAGSRDPGPRAILVHATPAHAISERAPQFYEHCGFLPSPMDPMTLMIAAAEAAKALLNRDSTPHRP